MCPKPEVGSVFVCGAETEEGGRVAQRGFLGGRAAALLVVSALGVLLAVPVPGVLPLGNSVGTLAH